MNKSEQAKLSINAEIARLKRDRKVDADNLEFVVSEMKRLSSELDPRVINAIRFGLNELAHSLSWYDDNIAAYYEEFDAIERRIANRKANAEAKKLQSVAA